MKGRLSAALALAVLVGTWGVSAAQAGGSAPQVAGSATSFSFSGKLPQPNGSYDFKFWLYDALTDGNLVAGPVVVSAVPVKGSAYSTRIDFGSDPFTGRALFLKIAWRPAGSGTFTNLSPRVELVAVPYALGLKLPYLAIANQVGALFNIQNSGGRAILAESASSDAVEATADTSGAGVLGASSGGYGLAGRSNSGFAGVYGTTNGASNGVYGEANNSGGSGVYGHNGGSGNGVAGISASGAGGYLSGVTGAVLEGGGGSNAAVALHSGGIKVIGAGTDTPTPVFTHVVTNSNTCASNGFAILDNPFLNNNPNAFVFLTSSNGYLEQGLAAFYNPTTTNCPGGRWLVQYNGTWSSGMAFNVLVIDP